LPDRIHTINRKYLKNRNRIWVSKITDEIKLKISLFVKEILKEI
jgi:hypothetical protein